MNLYRAYVTIKNNAYYTILFSVILILYGILYILHFLMPKSEHQKALYQSSCTDINHECKTLVDDWDMTDSDETSIGCKRGELCIGECGMSQDCP